MKDGGSGYSGLNQDNIEALGQVNFYKTIFDNLFEAIVIANSKSGFLLYANNSFFKLFGYHESEISNINLALLHPENIAAKDSLFSWHPQKKEISNVPCVRKDKSLFYADIRDSQIKLNGEEHILASFVDVTDRFNQQKNIEESERDFKNLVHHSPDIIYKFSNKRGAIFWSPQVEKILGFKVKELDNDPFLWNNSIHPEDKPLVEKAINDYNKGADYNIEYRIKTRWGKWIWLHDYFMHKAYEGDEIIIEGHAADITARKETEIALLNSENRLRTIIKTIPDLLFHVDKDGIFLSFFQENLQLYKQPQEFLGKSIFEIFDDELASLLFQSIKETLEKGSKEIFYSMEINGLRYYFAKMAKLSETEIITLVRDITELKEKEIELLKLNKDKDRYMQILAHDLRSPFNTILGFSKILINKFEKNTVSQNKEYLLMLYQTAWRTYKMLDDLLLWGKSQSGKLSYHPEKVGFLETCNEVVEEVYYLALLKNINLCSSIEDSIYLHCDKNMLKTVLLNLLTNAVKFTNKSGEIHIIAEANHNEVKITIADNGVGLDESEILHLWNKETNFSKIGTEKEYGTGLGLSICKDFVELNQGKIWVESEKEKGSRFCFTLPLFKG